MGKSKSVKSKVEPKQPDKSQKLLGHINVDSGLCWIGDPCYILHTEEGVPDDLGKNWEEFSDLIIKLPYKSFGGWGCAVFTAHGDGQYPVIGTMEGNTVMKITVDFDQRSPWLWGTTPRGAQGYWRGT